MGRVVRFEEGDLLATRSKDSTVYIQVGDARQDLEPDAVRELAETLLELVGCKPAVEAVVQPQGTKEPESPGQVVTRQSGVTESEIAELNKQLEDLILESFELRDGSDEFSQNSIKRIEIQEKIRNLLSQSDSSPQDAWVPPPRPRNKFADPFGGDPEVARLMGY